MYNILYDVVYEENYLFNGISLTFMNRHCSDVVDREGRLDDVEVSKFGKTMNFKFEIQASEDEELVVLLDSYSNSIKYGIVSFDCQYGTICKTLDDICIFQIHQMVTRIKFEGHRIFELVESRGFVYFGLCLRGDGLTSNSGERAGNVPFVCSFIYNGIIDLIFG